MVHSSLPKLICSKARDVYLLVFLKNSVLKQSSCLHYLQIEKQHPEAISYLSHPKNFEHFITRTCKIFCVFSDTVTNYLQVMQPPFAKIHAEKLLVSGNTSRTSIFMLYTFMLWSNTVSQNSTQNCVTRKSGHKLAILCVYVMIYMLCYLKDFIKCNKVWKQGIIKCKRQQSESVSKRRNVIWKCTNMPWFRV